MIGESRLLAGPIVTFASSAAELPSADPWCQILAGGTMALSARRLDEPHPTTTTPHNPSHAPNHRPSGPVGQHSWQRYSDSAGRIGNYMWSDAKNRLPEEDRRGSSRQCTLPNWLSSASSTQFLKWGSISTLEVIRKTK